MRKVTILVSILALASVLLAACAAAPPAATTAPTIAAPTTEVPATEEPATEAPATEAPTGEATATAAGAAETPVAPPVAGGERLQAILDRGNLICGVHGTFQGFGFLDTAGNWSGFDVDFCRAWAAASLTMRTRLNSLGSARKTALQLYRLASLTY